MPTALAVVPSSALTMRRSALSYVRGAVVSPVCLSIAVFAGCLGVGLAGAVGAVVAFVSAAMAIAVSTRYAFVRRHLDREAQARLRCAREHRRMTAIRPSGAMRIQQYTDLRTLVENVEAQSAEDAERFELQELLEQFANVIVAHQRYVDGLRMTAPELSMPQLEAASKRRRDLQTRRRRHREACNARITALADQIEAIDELVRLVAQRVLCPYDDLDIEAEIDRRVTELDDIDAAIRQMSA